MGKNSNIGKIKGKHVVSPNEKKFTLEIEKNV